MAIISISFNFAQDRRHFSSGIEAEVELRKVSKCLLGSAKVRVLHMQSSSSPCFVPMFYDIELEADRQFLELDKWAIA